MRRALFVCALCCSVCGCNSTNQPAERPSPTPAPEATSPAAANQPPCSDCVPVTVENFARAETDFYFNNLLKRPGAKIGVVGYNRVPTPIDQQDVIRSNRDTLYSGAIFDLDAGPVTITLPDAGKRFRSMLVENEDGYVPMVVYDKGTYTLSREKIGTRYVMTLVRTLMDPNNAADLAQANKLQDAMKVSQKSPGTFEIPRWDKASQDKVRGALQVLAATLPDIRHGFGAKGEVDPVRFLLATATVWGGNPDKDAIYLNVVPKNNDGTGVYKLTVKDVPVQAFWSITLYNARGFLEKNPYDAYSVNDITGKKNSDGSITVQFGGCDGKIPNCLPTMPGWNYIVRLYRPRPEVLNGTYKFPEAQKLS